MEEHACDKPNQKPKTKNQGQNNETCLGHRRVEVRGGDAFPPDEDGAALRLDLCDGRLELLHGLHVRGWRRHFAFVFFGFGGSQSVRPDNLPPQPVRGVGR